MSAKRIYLAVPYSDPDPQVREYRYKTVTEYANRLMREGHLVYSPITHGHVITAWGGLQGDFDTWREHCLSFLRLWAEELHILCLPGCLASTGVWAEVEEARRLRLPVVQHTWE